MWLKCFVEMHLGSCSWRFPHSVFVYSLVPSTDTSWQLIWCFGRVSDMWVTSHCTKKLLSSFHSPNISALWSTWKLQDKSSLMSLPTFRGPLCGCWSLCCSPPFFTSPSVFNVIVSFHSCISSYLSFLTYLLPAPLLSDSCYQFHSCLPCFPLFMVQIRCLKDF